MRARRSALLGAAIVALLATGLLSPVHGAAGRSLPCTNVQTFNPYPDETWMGPSNATELTVMSRQGACLDAVLFTPLHPVAPVPAVVLEPGAGGTTSDVGWAARYLAGAGYEALDIVQQGQGGSEVVQPSGCTPNASPGLLSNGERVTQICTGLPPAANIDNAVD